MVEESAPNPTMTENEISTSNNSNESEHTKSQLWENLKAINDPKDVGRKNFLTPGNCDHDTSVSTLTETPTNIDQNQSNQNPSKIDINVITFQLNYSVDNQFVSLNPSPDVNWSIVIWWITTMSNARMRTMRKMDMIQMEITCASWPSFRCWWNSVT